MKLALTVRPFRGNGQGHGPSPVCLHCTAHRKQCLCIHTRRLGRKMDCAPAHVRCLQRACRTSSWPPIRRQKRPAACNGFSAAARPGSDSLPNRSLLAPVVSGAAPVERMCRDRHDHRQTSFGSPIPGRPGVLEHPYAAIACLGGIFGSACRASSFFGSSS